MKKDKIYILTNPLDHEGGIVNYYNLFFKNFNSNKLSLKHGNVGSRSYLFYYPILKALIYPIFYFYDLLKFTLNLIFDNTIKIVQVSPSLIPVPLIRDGIIIIIAKLLGKKIVVFYRGWKLPTFKKIYNSSFLRIIFKTIFQKKTLQFVLASSFKKDLLKLKPKKIDEIIVTTTAIDKSQIIKPKAIKQKKIIKVLFLARIQDLKGIEELIEAICLLNKEAKLKDFKFTIAGHENKKGYIDTLKEKLKFNNVPSNKTVFLGRVTGKNKFLLYSNHDIYVLPSYTEGCPNSLLEALASGMFCITTNVGALSDLIYHKKNGLLVNTKDSKDLFNSLLYCLKNKDCNKNRLANSDKYSEKFDIEKITNLFKEKYSNLIEN